jgi:hypothetical protein
LKSETPDTRLSVIPFCVHCAFKELWCRNQLLEDTARSV